MNLIELLTGLRDAIGFHLYDENNIIRVVADERCMGHDDKAYIEISTKQGVYIYEIRENDIKDLRTIYDHIMVDILTKRGVDATEYGGTDD